MYSGGPASYPWCVISVVGSVVNVVMCSEVIRGERRGGGVASIVVAASSFGIASSSSSFGAARACKATATSSSSMRPSSSVIVGRGHNIIVLNIVVIVSVTNRRFTFTFGTIPDICFSVYESGLGTAARSVVGTPSTIAGDTLCWSTKGLRQ